MYFLIFLEMTHVLFLFTYLLIVVSLIHSHMTPEAASRSVKIKTTAPSGLRRGPTQPRSHWLTAWRHRGIIGHGRRQSETGRRRCVSSHWALGENT